jgi:hypothetical protein
MEATSLRFAAAARAVGHVARQHGLMVPGFRSPPRVPGADRTLRRRPDGGAVVSVRLRGRPWMASVSDMVDGVVVANRLTGPDADALRRALWAALESAALLTATEPPPGSRGAARPPRARHLRVARSTEAA